MSRKFKAGQMVKYIDLDCTDDAYKVLGYDDYGMVVLEFDTFDGRVFEDEIELVKGVSNDQT